MALITIFSAPKPFSNPHIDTIQRNAIQSWIHLGEQVEVILIGEETGMAEVAAAYRVKHLPEVERNPQGTPLVSSIFDLARGNSSSPLLAYVNADILLLPDFISAAQQVLSQKKNFLVVGQRWDLDVPTALDFSPGWAERLNENLKRRGRLHPPGGSDYFIFPRACFNTIPDFAIGRAGWDNWMIYEARRQGWAVIDATQGLPAIHQDHDYSHLPGGQPHYRLPETEVNVHLAGGRRAIFSLRDANFLLQSGKVQPIPRRGNRLWREMEIYPLVKLHSRLLGELSYAFFHPIKAFNEWRGRLYVRLKKIKGNQGGGTSG